MNFTWPWSRHNEAKDALKQTRSDAQLTQPLHQKAREVLDSLDEHRRTNHFAEMAAAAMKDKR